MARERFAVVVAVYGLLAEGDRLLLVRRAGSGYRDGQLSLPAGHLDGEESVVSALVRELAEELGVVVDPADCQLALTMHRPPESPGDREYLDLFFTVGRWQGVPAIGEPGKCSELVWAPRNELPGDVAGYVADAVGAVAVGQRLLLPGWAAHEEAGA